MAMQAFSSVTGDGGGRRTAPASQEGLVIVDDVCHAPICDEGLQLRVHQQHFGAAVVQDPGQFGGGEAGVQHHQDGADRHGAEVGFERHRAVGREHRDAVAGLHAEREQRGGLALHAGGEFGVGEAAVAIHHGDAVAPGVGAAGEKIERSEGRDHASQIVYHRMDCTANRSEAISRVYQYSGLCSAALQRLQSRG